MRLFVYVLASALLGAAIILLQLATVETRLLQVLGNIMFCACIAALVGRSRSNPLGSVAVVLTPPAYIASAVLLAIAGMAVYEWWRPAGMALMGLLALGYAPSAGPDAPFFARLPFWVLSNLLIVVAGIAIGAWLRARRVGSRASSSAP